MEIISLKSGEWSAQLVPGVGCNVISLCCQNHEILRTPNSLEQLQKEPQLYGLPLLFPPNRTKDGSFEFMGKKYQLEVNEPERENHLHGKLLWARFETVLVKEDSAEFVYHNKGECFPFDFDVSVKVLLDKEGMREYITFTNTGAEAMPLIFGCHATFMETAPVCVPLGKRYEIDENYIPTGKMLELTSEQEEYVTGFNPHEKVAAGFYKSTGRRVRLGDYAFEVSEGFNDWVLFNGGGGKGYVCTEPQTGPVNGLNTGEYEVLEPGQSAKLELLVSLWK